MAWRNARIRGSMHLTHALHLVTLIYIVRSQLNVSRLREMRVGIINNTCKNMMKLGDNFSEYFFVEVRRSTIFIAGILCVNLRELRSLSLKLKNCEILKTWDKIKKKKNTKKLFFTNKFKLFHVFLQKFQSQILLTWQKVS
jgi:hypothetical protein